MTFLPIVGRELRVAARKRSTFWVRIIATLANLAALSWFGMWMGMTSKNSNLAAL